MTNETKHTPGPWHIGMKPGPIIYGLRGAQVADLSARMVPDDETRGNVRLIAAAPELLDALFNALPYVEDVLDNPEQLACFKAGVVERHAKAIRAAIAKATGG
jgi:hypothetical protein